MNKKTLNARYIKYIISYVIYGQIFAWIMVGISYANRPPSGYEDHFIFFPMFNMVQGAALFIVIDFLIALIIGYIRYYSYKKRVINRLKILTEKAEGFMSLKKIFFDAGYKIDPYQTKIKRCESCNNKYRFISNVDIQKSRNTFFFGIFYNNETDPKYGEKTKEFKNKISGELIKIEKKFLNHQKECQKTKKEFKNKISGELIKIEKKFLNHQEECQKTEKKIKIKKMIVFTFSSSVLILILGLSLGLGLKHKNGPVPVPVPGNPGTPMTPAIPNRNRQVFIPEQKEH